MRPQIEYDQLPTGGAMMEVKSLAGGTCRVRWVDSRQGGVIAADTKPLQEGVLHFWLSLTSTEILRAPSGRDNPRK